MANRNHCSECGSKNTRRSRVIYEQGVSTIYGPNFDTTRVSALAAKVAPPAEPINPTYWNARSSIYNAISVTLAMVGVAPLYFLGKEVAIGPLYIYMSVAIVVALRFFWLGRPPKGSLTKKTYPAAIDAYQREIKEYENNWYCMDCGCSFKVGF